MPYLCSLVNRQYSPTSGALYHFTNLLQGLSPRLVMIYTMDGCSTFDEWIHRYPAYAALLRRAILVAHAWTVKRHELRFSDWPWRLVQMCDPRATQDQREELAQMFMLTPSCCLRPLSRVQKHMSSGAFVFASSCIYSYQSPALLASIHPCPSKLHCFLVRVCLRALASICPRRKSSFASGAHRSNQSHLTSGAFVFVSSCTYPPIPSPTVASGAFVIASSCIHELHMSNQSPALLLVHLCLRALATQPKSSCASGALVFGSYCIYSL